MLIFAQDIEADVWPGWQSLKYGQSFEAEVWSSSRNLSLVQNFDGNVWYSGLSPEKTVLFLPLVKILNLKFGGNSRYLSKTHATSPCVMQHKKSMLGSVVPVAMSVLFKVVWKFSYFQFTVNNSSSSLTSSAFSLPSNALDAMAWSYISLAFCLLLHG